MSELDKEYESSLKSIETENIIDRIFYRPTRMDYSKVAARLSYIARGLSWLFSGDNPFGDIAGELSIDKLKGKLGDDDID